MTHVWTARVDFLKSEATTPGLRQVLCVVGSQRIPLSQEMGIGAPAVVISTFPPHIGKGLLLAGREMSYTPRVRVVVNSPVLEVFIEYDFPVEVLVSRIAPS